LKKIPLIDLHKQLGASVGEFAGYETPMSYGSVIDEHMSVRNSSGIFDISHMALFLLEGPGWLDALEKLLPKRVEGRPRGAIVGPTAFLNERAGIKDDVLVYPLRDGNYIIVGNAINTEKDLKWLSEHAPPGGSVELLNGPYSLIALQGPLAPEAAEELVPGAKTLNRMAFLENVETRFGRVRIVSRSGWTGEDGFEFLAETSVAERIFRYYVERGVKPCGLAARDTLRLEMGFLLYGQDMDEETTPVEARYWHVFDQGKQDCIGCSALIERMRSGAREVRVGLRLKKGEKAIPRKAARVLVQGEEVGRVTSGGYSPVLERPIAMAYLRPSHALMGMTVTVEVRGRLLEAKIVDFPFIETKSK